MSEDERAIRERLAALESEVKAEANAQKARKEAALELVQAERARRADKAAAVEKAGTAKAATAEKAKAAQPARPAKAAKAPPPDDSDSILEDLAASASKRERASQKDRGRMGLGDALELAKRAGDLKQELTAPRKKGQKSWMVSAGLSTAFGPLGWLYAGSWREAAPVAAIWVVGLYLANWILPFILLMPALMVALPLSGIAGAVYAFGYNRAGSRQRLFGEDKPKPKQLGPSDE